jgi:hypothetical protein
MWQVTRSRTEPVRRVRRARMLLAYREDPSFFAAAHALDDRPRSGKEPTIATEAKEAKELGYPHELWTTRLSARMRVSMDRRKDTAVSPSCRKARCARPGSGEGAQSALLPGTARSRINSQDAGGLCIYREVKIIRETAAAAKQKPSDAVAIV